MSELWKRVAEFFVEGLGKNAFFRSLSFAILFSLLMTYVIGAIEGVFEPKTTFPYFTLLSQPYWIGVIFVSFALLFAILGYLSQLNARDDLLTPLRRKLIGIWEVRSQSWRIEQGKIAFGWVVSHCVISIEPIGGKLLLRFEIANSDLFKDQKIDVATTAFSFDGANRKLIYFYETELELKNPLGAPPDQIKTIEFPFLCVLKIEFDDSEKVHSMKGHWYDINNGIYNLARRFDHLAGLAELSDAVGNGAVTFGGAVEFKRLPAPAGTPVDAGV